MPSSNDTSRPTHGTERAPIPDRARSKDYKKTLRRLQVELVRLQRHFIKRHDVLTRLYYAKKIIFPWDAAAGSVDILAP